MCIYFRVVGVFSHLCVVTKKREMNTKGGNKQTNKQIKKQTNKQKTKSIYINSKSVFIFLYWVSSLIGAL